MTRKIKTLQQVLDENHKQVQSWPKYMRILRRPTGPSQHPCRYCGAENESLCKCEGYASNVIKSGEWVQPRRKGYLMKCCDCGLVHRMDFRIYKGRIQFRAFRHEDGKKEQ